MSPDPTPLPHPEHDPQEGPTMRQVRRARAEAYEAARGRSPQEQRTLEERLARDFGLPMRRAEPDRTRRSA